MSADQKAVFAGLLNDTARFLEFFAATADDCSPRLAQLGEQFGVSMRRHGQDAVVIAAALDKAATVLRLPTLDEQRKES